MAESGQRLTSWKEIAAHFGRDVRTVMRWEKDRALPVQRGPNGKTGVVFADTAELDAWMRGSAPEAVAPDVTLVTPVTPVVLRARGAARRWATAAGLVVATAIGLGGWRAHVSRASEQPDSAVLTERAVVGVSADGTEKWRHTFAGRVSPPFSRLETAIEPLAGEGLLAATSVMISTDTLTPGSGQLLLFDHTGRMRESFSFEDTVRMGARDYSGPWSLSDYRQQGSGPARVIAVAAHHYEWWPSIVTILDRRWQRRSSFVNAGWVEQLRWLSPALLAISGFSNQKDGGMVALLDTGAMNGQSPAASNSGFDCASCGPDRPLRYVVMPRSEVNRVSASPFNRASFSLRAGMLVVLTEELPHTSTLAPANALYEFTQQLALVHASYTDRYWEAHRDLERLGTLTHTREQCPERDGPPQIEIWEPEAGWTVHPVRRTASR